MNTTTIELSVEDRIMFLQIISIMIPESPPTWWKMLDDVKAQIGFTPEEIEECGITNEGKAVHWTYEANKKVFSYEIPKMLLIELDKFLKQRSAKKQIQENLYPFAIRVRNMKRSALRST